jgi:hypothetical protein
VLKKLRKLLLMMLVKWVLMPLSSSTTVSLKLAVIPVSPKIDWPRWGSQMPSANFCFLDDLVEGKWVVKKALRVLDTVLAASY